MIYLFSNIYATYLEARSHHFSDVVAVGAGKNFMESSVGKKLGRYDSVAEADVPALLSDLHSKISNGTSKRVIIHISKAEWNPFICRWLKTVYKSLPNEELTKVYNLYYKMSLLNHDDITFHDDKGTLSRSSVVEEYWRNPDFDLDYWDLDQALIPKMGIEYLISNYLFTQDRFYLSLIEQRVGLLYNDAVINELKKYREKIDTLSHYRSVSITDFDDLSSDPLLEAIYNVASKDFSLDVGLLSKAVLVDYIETPILAYIKQFNQHLPTELLVADVLGNNVYDLLLPLRDKGKISLVPMLISKAFHGKPDSNKYMPFYLPE